MFPSQQQRIPRCSGLRGNVMANRYGTTASDNLTGTTSADVFYMTADNFRTDTLNGGAGSDTVDYSASQVGVTITLTNPTTKGGNSGGTVEADFTSTTYNPATGSYIYMHNHQVLANLTSIENATGSSYNDVLKGNGSANTLNGRGGNDIIDGGYGNDTIIGGGGRDTMTGGSGNDKFVFQNASDGPMNVTTYTEMDTITDFVRGEDKIDLRGLVDEVAGGGALSYIDTAVFSGVAGQVREVFTGYGWLVQADLDGDQDADFQVMVDSTSLYELHAHLQTSDFILA
jgi:Ca2+-binding RTX toxin-like protein